MGRLRKDRSECVRRTVVRPAAFAILCFLLTSPIIAQGSVRFGIKGGVDWARQIGEYAVSWRTKSGFTGGAFAAFSMSKGFEIRPELLVTSKGARFYAPPSPQYALGAEFTLRFYYLELPVVLRYVLPVEGSIRPHFVAGPYIAFRLDSNIRVASTHQKRLNEWIMLPPERTTKDYDIKDMQVFDTGIILGGGIDVSLMKGTVSLEARYALGLTDTGELNPEGVGLFPRETKNSVISLMIGYIIGI